MVGALKLFSFSSAHALNITLESSITERGTSDYISPILASNSPK